MEDRERPIGVFDSGVGGISVLKELYKIMPEENYIYFGDSRNAPYGTKPLEEIRRLTIANVEQLLTQGQKALLSHVILQLRRQYVFCGKCIRPCLWLELNRR